MTGRTELDSIELAFRRKINADPTDRATQIVYADWLDGDVDRSAVDPARAEQWRHGFDFRGSRAGGFVGRVGLGGRAGGFARRGGLVGRGGRGGLGGLIGRGSFVGLGGLIGRGSFIGSGVGHGSQPVKENIVLIPGENAMVFLPHGYGFSVLIGHVASELAHGWILNPAREIIDTHNSDCWVELAGGKPSLRAACQYGQKIKGGARIPFGVFSLPWDGELPK